LLNTSINANKILSKIHIALVFSLSLIKAVLELHKIREAFFVQAFFQTGLLLAFLIGLLVEAFLQLMIKLIISSISQKFFFVAIKILYLRLEIYDYIIVLINAEEF
jgi:hypothetical protein